MRNTLISGLFCGALLIQGCATSGIEGTGNPNAAPEHAKHLVLHNETLANKIIIQQMNVRKKAGLLQVSAVLANLTSRDKKIQYRFSWYDADNFEVEKDIRSWNPVVLSGKSTIHMQAVAPNPTVTSYKINVKELK